MKRWMKVTLVVLTGIIVLACGYGVYVYHSIQTAANRMYEQRKHASIDGDMKQSGDVERADSASIESVQRLAQMKPFTVLVLGVDQRPNDRGRSDAMILLAVNPARKGILMFNIPRDTRVELVGRGTEDKINHAYAFGGVSMAVQTVEQFLDYPVQYYVKLDMEGFSKIIDLLGGVEVNNALEFYYENHHFEKGLIALNGAEALAYSRMRFDDPRGDLGRNSRQREIIQQVIKKAMNISLVVRLNEFLEKVGDSVRTDMTFDEMKLLLTRYRTELEFIEQNEIQGSGQRINGIYYYIVQEAERSRIQRVLAQFQQEEAAP